MRLSSVDFPAFGFPATVTIPARDMRERVRGKGERLNYNRGNGDGERLGATGTSLFPSPIPPSLFRQSLYGPFPWPASPFPKEKSPYQVVEAFQTNAGDGILSRALSGGVPSALQGLTA